MTSSSSFVSRGGEPVRPVGGGLGGHPRLARLGRDRRAARPRLIDGLFCGPSCTQKMKSLKWSLYYFLESIQKINFKNVKLVM